MIAYFQTTPYDERITVPTYDLTWLAGKKTKQNKKQCLMGKYRIIIETKCVIFQHARVNLLEGNKNHEIPWISMNFHVTHWKPSTSRSKFWPPLHWDYHVSSDMAQLMAGKLHLNMSRLALWGFTSTCIYCGRIAQLRRTAMQCGRSHHQHVYNIYKYMYLYTLLRCTWFKRLAFHKPQSPGTCMKPRKKHTTTLFNNRHKKTLFVDAFFNEPSSSQGWLVTLPENDLSISKPPPKNLQWSMISTICWWNSWMV